MSLDAFSIVHDALTSQREEAILTFRLSQDFHQTIFLINEFHEDHPELLKFRNIIHYSYHIAGGVLFKKFVFNEDGKKFNIQCSKEGGIKRIDHAEAHTDYIYESEDIPLKEAYQRVETFKQKVRNTLTS